MTLEVSPFVPSCGSRGCDEPRAPDRLVCAMHSEALDRIRDELATERERRRLRPGRKGRGSTCCRAGCWNERERSKPYCPTCEAEHGLPGED